VAHGFLVRMRIVFHELAPALTIYHHIFVQTGAKSIV